MIVLVVYFRLPFGGGGRLLLCDVLVLPLRDRLLFAGFPLGNVLGGSDGNLMLAVVVIRRGGFLTASGDHGGSRLRDCRGHGRGHEKGAEGSE